jgi:phage recombination protein Bet
VTEISTTALVPAAAAAPQVLATPEQVKLLKRTLGADLTDDELALFGEVARRRGLDPFTRQIHAVKRDGKMSIQTGIDGFRLIAERTGQYRGQRGPWWAGPDGEWRELWTGPGAPHAARVAVLRDGWPEPTYGIAHYAEYRAPAPMWTKMPANQLAKCAEALALRKAFPQELSGLYTDDEMAQADAPPAVQVQAVQTRRAPRPLPENRRRVVLAALAAAGLNDDRNRHDLVHLITGGRTESSTELLEGGDEQLILAVDLIAGGYVRFTDEGQLLREGRPVAIPFDVLRIRAWLDGLNAAAAAEAAKGDAEDAGEQVAGDAGGEAHTGEPR